MNETLKTILERRSIRVYRPEQITAQELETILQAGRYAPSGGNAQAWHFTVVQNKDLLAKINEGCRGVLLNSGNEDFIKRARAENFSIFYNAPTLIIVSVDQKARTPQQDCSIALGYMFLGAHSIGIGSCWINAVVSLLGSAEGGALKKELGIPDGSAVLGSGAFGYRAGDMPAAAPRTEGTVTMVR